MIRNIRLLGAALVIYIVANLAVGYTFSTIAQNQLQAMQMTLFFLLPAILLSGFAFPFMGMPGWARAMSSHMPSIVASLGGRAKMRLICLPKMPRPANDAKGPPSGLRSNR